MSINLTAPINQLGFGQVSTNLALAMEAKGLSPALWLIGAAEVQDKHHAAIRRMVDRTQFYDKLAPSLRVYHQFELAQHVGKGPHCAYPFFELNRFRPVELHHLKNQDIVFASSWWAARVLIDNGIPIERIRLARPGIDRSIFRFSDVTVADGPTTFLNVGKWEYRKGHDIIIEAFEKAFTQTDNVRLVMHCYNPCLRSIEELERYNAQWASLYKNSKLGDKITVSDRRLPSQDDVSLLMSQADCGIFPSRAEGWNLEAAEMMAMGKQVILTNYTAHTEYATPGNARCIYIDAVEDAHDGIWFKANSPDWNGKPGQWAELGEAQVDQIVEHMRIVHRLKQSGQLTPNKIGASDMANFTWENTVDEIMKGLE